MKNIETILYGLAVLHGAVFVAIVLGFQSLRWRMRRIARDLHIHVERITDALSPIERDLRIIAKPFERREKERSEKAWKGLGLFLRALWARAAQEARKPRVKPSSTMADPPTTAETGVNL